MRILIAGLGAIGQRHARNLRALRRRRRRAARLPPAPPAGTSSPTRSGATTRATWKPSSASPRSHDLDDALAAKPDARVRVHAVEPAPRDRPAGRRGGCHLFIEKPVSHSLDGVDRLRETVASQGSRGAGRLPVALSSLRPAAARRARAGHARPVGTRRSTTPSISRTGTRTRTTARRTPRAPSSAAASSSTQIHDYDLAWWLFGAPRAVTATGGHLSDLEIDVEDTVDATLDRRRRARCACARRSPPGRRAAPSRCIGERGTVDARPAGCAASPRIRRALRRRSRSLDYQRNQMFVDEAGISRPASRGRRRRPSRSRTASPSSGWRWPSRRRCAPRARCRAPEDHGMTACRARTPAPISRSPAASRSSPAAPGSSASATARRSPRPAGYRCSPTSRGEDASAQAAGIAKAFGVPAIGRRVRHHARRNRSSASSRRSLDDTRESTFSSTTPRTIRKVEGSGKDFSRLEKLSARPVERRRRRRPHGRVPVRQIIGGALAAPAARRHREHLARSTASSRRTSGSIAWRACPTTSSR